VSKEIKVKKPFKPADGLYDPSYSIIGSLLCDISWSGNTVNKYRKAGKGYENVLTAEVFQILDFLPRTFFLGEVLRNLHSKNTKVLERLNAEVEELRLNLFPGNHYLKKNPTSHQSGVSVQPDGLFETPSIYGLLELKRIKKSGSFQPLQLAREFYLVTRDAKEKIPFMILVIAKEPPVPVHSNGNVDLVPYIQKTLPEVYKSADSHHLSLSQLQDMVEDHISWITWSEIKTIISQLKEKHQSNNSSIDSSVTRLCDTLIHAIDFHS
jgi:hypothetical protein